MYSSLTVKFSVSKCIQCYCFQPTTAVSNATMKWATAVTANNKSQSDSEDSDSDSSSSDGDYSHILMFRFGLRNGPQTPVAINVVLLVIRFSIP